MSETDAGLSMANRSIHDAKGERMASTRSDGEKINWLYGFRYILIALVKLIFYSALKHGVRSKDAVFQPLLISIIHISKETQGVKMLKSEEISQELSEV